MPPLRSAGHFRDHQQVGVAASENFRALLLAMRSRSVRQCEAQLTDKLPD
jgi:hypothetical protein